MPTAGKQPSGKVPSKGNAFVLVEGKRVFPVKKHVIRIGRKNDNDIILADQHVSRYHAEIRLLDGEYHLTDLQSTVGTSVNGIRITETILQAGDVISIGGVPLIFGRGHKKITIPAQEPDDFPDPMDTGPTDTITLEDADRYLDFFKD